MELSHPGWPARAALDYAFAVAVISMNVVEAFCTVVMPSFVQCSSFRCVLSLCILPPFTTAPLHALTSVVIRVDTCHPTAVSRFECAKAGLGFLGDGSPLVRSRGKAPVGGIADNRRRSPSEAKACLLMNA